MTDSGSIANYTAAQREEANASSELENVERTIRELGNNPIPILLRWRQAVAKKLVDAASLVLDTVKKQIEQNPDSKEIGLYNLKKVNGLGYDYFANKAVYNSVGDLSQASTFLKENWNFFKNHRDKLADVGDRILYSSGKPLTKDMADKIRSDPHLSAAVDESNKRSSLVDMVVNRPGDAKKVLGTSKFQEINSNISVDQRQKITEAKGNYEAALGEYNKNKTPEIVDKLKDLRFEYQNKTSEVAKKIDELNPKILELDKKQEKELRQDIKKTEEKKPEETKTENDKLLEDMNNQVLGLNEEKEKAKSKTVDTVEIDTRFEEAAKNMRNTLQDNGVVSEHRQQYLVRNQPRVVTPGPTIT